MILLLLLYSSKNDKMVSYVSKRIKKVYKRKGKGNSYRKAYVKSTTMPKGFAKAVKRVMYKSIETKKTVHVNDQRANILHNDLVVLDSAPLKTSQGTGDPNVSGTMANRVGDEVTPVGLSIKFMTVLDPRQQQVFYRWMLIRGPFGDIPTKATLFTGATNNKRLDSINTERWTIVAQKYFKATRPNASIGGTDYTMSEVKDGLLTSTGNYVTAGAQDQSYCSYPISIWIPAKKLAKGNLQYQQDAQSPKTYSWTSCIIAYTSYKASTGLAILGTMEDYVSKFYFKDA